MPKPAINVIFSIVQYISLLPYKLKEVVALKKLGKDGVNV
jgi:hypothetical protein